MNSLRSKVFLGVLGGLLLVTLVAEVVLYRQAVSFAENELFDSLRRYAIALKQIVYLDSNNKLTVYADWEDRLRITRQDRAEYFEFKTFDDDFITDSHNLGGDSLPVIGTNHGHRLIDYGNILLGVYEYHFTIATAKQKNIHFKLVVADNTGLISDARASTIRTLLLFTPIALVAAFFVSFVLSTIILSSLSKFTSKVLELKFSDSKSHLDLTAVDEEMIPLGQAINNYIDQINSHVKHESRLLAETAHELRIPLKNMRTELNQIAKGTPGSANIFTGLDTIDSNVSGLQQMTDNMLMLYRIESGKYHPRLSMFDLKEELTINSRRFLQSESIGLRLHGNATQVFSNRPTISLILSQLIYNVCQYAPGSPIDISWSRLDDHVLLHVDDAGPGIPKNERERIFRRLYRFENLNQAESGCSGNGLGLALVRLYAESINAMIRCTDSPMGGARFTVTLPGECPTKA